MVEVAAGLRAASLGDAPRSRPDGLPKYSHVQGVDARTISTIYRATLFFVAGNQNITLSLPRALLKRVKRVAADRDTSVSALMAEALDRLADEDRRYTAARRRALAAMKTARSLGTAGQRTWSRDDLHDR